ncbi:MAG: hypothetical protein JW934_23400 [Anaerolineae bacterium]|nr:hypothetical protein [Anaerolineae bacterium]
MTTVSIHGTEFWIDGRPTYAGRQFEGHKIQGLLFNVRAVQATFDDANPGTRPLWAFPDTGVWNPDRNTDEFCAALPQWRDHGILAFTICGQGGGARYLPEVYDHYDNSAFTPDGALKPAYASRVEKVLARADELGMAVIVGMFYWKQTLKMNGEAAIWRAARELLAFLQNTGRKNILIEIGNETGPRFGFDLFLVDCAAEMIRTLRKEFPGFLYSTSQGGLDVEHGRELPTSTLIDAVDFLMPHGNGNTAERLAAGLDAILIMPAYQADPKPILINEDSTGVANLDVCWPRYVSWGYYDQGSNGESRRHDLYADFSAPRESDYDSLSGFQTPPVNWTINTGRKRAFFERVAEITGVSDRR